MTDIYTPYNQIIEFPVTRGLKNTITDANRAAWLRIIRAMQKANDPTPHRLLALGIQGTAQAKRP